MLSIRERTERGLRRAVPAVALALSAAPGVSCKERLAAPFPAAPDQDASPKQGGTLRLAHLGDVRNLDPAGPLDGVAAEAVQVIFAGLVEFDENARVIPGIADHWDVDDEGRTYRFVLRHGVRMHDGDELTSDDVVRSVERRSRPVDAQPERELLRRRRPGRRERPVRGHVSTEGFGCHVPAPVGDAHASPHVQERRPPILGQLDSLRCWPIQARAGRLAPRNEPSPGKAPRVLPAGRAVPRCGGVDVQRAGAAPALPVRGRRLRYRARPDGRPTWPASWAILAGALT